MSRKFIALATISALLCGWVTLAAPNLRAQDEAWPTYLNLNAAYRFDYPPNSVIQELDDAGLRYPLVHIQFPVTDTEAYQGASVLVLDNAAALSPVDFVAQQALAARASAPPPSEQQALAVPDAPAERQGIVLTRDGAVGELDAQTALIPGDGVMYRINLFGGGVGGGGDPTPQAQAMYVRLLRSFHTLESPLQPKAARAAAVPNAVAQTATATEFSYPLQDGDGVNYGVPVGIVLDRTRMEWLDYGIRNLDQWRIKCYGVDWSRMIHTGEDWYRLDYLTANSAGTPVYAVADGVVVRHSPGLSYPGNVVVIQHALPEGRPIYSMYGHVANVRVVVGDRVSRGQQIATIFNQGYVGRTPGRHPSWDSHLHFEMRWRADMGDIYTPGSNAYNYNFPSCTWLYPGRGYTYRIHPDNYPYPDDGYVDPSDFIAARQISATVSGMLHATGILTDTQVPTGTVPLTPTTHLPLVLNVYPVPPPEPVCSNVLVNGGFEASTGWAGIANTSGTIYAPPVFSGAQARSGARSGRVGSPTVNGYWDEVLQTALVPTDAVTVTLSFWRYLDTSETSTSAAYDVFRYGLETDKGIEVMAPRRIDNTSAGRARWVQESATLADARPYAGKNLWISFKGTTDGNRPSSLYLDDVELTVCR